MSAITTAVYAVERTTRVRRRTTRRAVGDCPVCRRPRRLEVSEGRDGRVLLLCQAGCETQAVLDRLGLGWRDLFEQVSYVPPTKGAERLVLDAIARGERWTITTHEFGDDLDLALAVEIAEHLLPARHRVRDRLRFRAGRKIAWELFPLTIGFVIAVARKLGTPVGEHRAARLIHLLIEHGLIEQVEWINVQREDESRRFRIFRLASATRATWDEKLSRAETASSTRSEPSTTHHPATTPFLAAGDGLSSPSMAVEGAGERRVRPCSGRDRAPPANGSRP